MIAEMKCYTVVDVLSSLGLIIIGSCKVASDDSEQRHSWQSVVDVDKHVNQLQQQQQQQQGAAALNVNVCPLNVDELEMWANAQRDGRPAEYRWRPLFNAAKFG